MNKMSDSEIIERGIEALETEGWVQGRYHAYFYDEIGSTPKIVGSCMVGSLARAQGSALNGCLVQGEVMARVISTVQEIARDLPPLYDGSFSCPDFNDTPGRTKEEVIDQMMITAKRLRDEGR